MNNPHLENGYTKIANEIMDALSMAMPGFTEGQIILAVMRKTYGWNKGEDNISISQLCAMTNKSKRMVIYALQNLEAKKMIIIERATKNGEKQTNRIKFNKRHKEWVVQNIAPQVEKNQIQAKVSSAKSRGSAKLTKEVVQNLRKSLPSFAHTKETITKETITKEINSKMSEGDWERYWEEYPNKVDKKEAHALFMRLAKELLDPLLTGLSSQKKEKMAQKERKVFCPEWKSPARWLRQECWNDNIQPFTEEKKPSKLKYLNQNHHE